MTGPMCEAKDGTATIHDVEVDSFTRFAEYIYGADYNAVQPILASEKPEKAPYDYAFAEPPMEEPVPAVEEPDMEEPAAEAPAVEDDWLFSGWSSRKGAGKAISKPTLPSLADYSVVSPVTEAFPVVLRAISPSTNPIEDCDTLWDFTEVFLCHARVYSMADRFQVPRLKELAISKIHMLLRQIVDYDHCYLSDLVSLLDYVYSHTMHLESTREPLRDLLAHYVAWDFRIRMEDEDFKAFLAENGAFAQDVCEKVSMRL
jgi:hypothetical protein